MLVRLAWRSIWRNRRRTIITVFSIGMGMAFAVFFICFAEGVYTEMIDNVVRMQAGHITLEHPDYHDAPAIDLYISDLAELRERIQAMPEVEETKLLVLGQGVARTGQGTVGAAIMGVEPSVEVQTSSLTKQIVSGRYLEDGDEALVVVGVKLARHLHLRTGKKLVLTTNDASGALTEELCRVAGIFETGVDEIDGYLVQTPIPFTRKLYGLPADSATQLGVILKKPETQGRMLKRISAMFPGNTVQVYPWQDIMPELANYIRLDKGSNLVMQAILLFLILFTIFNTILMSVMERQREFAVMLAIGTEPKLLRGQIALESFFIGLLGAVFGLIVGGSASYALQVYGFDITRLYSEGMSVSGVAISPVVHARVTPGVLITLTAIVIGATLIISLVPMRRATRVQIADTLR